MPPWKEVPTDQASGSTLGRVLTHPEGSQHSPQKRVSTDIHPVARRGVHSKHRARFQGHRDH